MPIAYVGNLGTNNNRTSGNTLATTVTSGASPGTLIVVVVACDNLSATTPTITFSDSVGNTYTTIVEKATNATAAAGVTGAIGAALLSTALVANTSTVTATMSGNVTAKVMNVFAFSGVGTSTRVASVTGSGSSTAPTVTSGTAQVGDLTLGLIAYEDSSALSAADADTTNGSWSTNVNQLTSGGGAATNVGLSFQYKIQTTTASAQTYNNTLATSTDWVSLVATLEPVIERTATGSGTGSQTASAPPVSFTDSFTRANSTTSVGGDWNVQTGTLGITSNAAYMPSGTSAMAYQFIQTSGRKQVVRATVTAPASAGQTSIYIAWQDADNYIALVRSYAFATYILTKRVAGVSTNLGNTGLSATLDAYVTIVRDGDVFYASAQSTTAGQNQTRTIEYTVTGLTGNGVGFSFDTSSTSFTIDDFSARPFVTYSRTATGSGTGSQTATPVKTAIRTATGSGTGSATTVSYKTRQRTATGAGTGTSTAVGARTLARTATANGTGSATNAQLLTRIRTATGTGLGTQTTTAITSRLRTATGNGTGTATSSQLRQILRSATSNGTGTQSAERTYIRSRTATGIGTGTSAVTWSFPSSISVTASATGTGSSSVTWFIPATISRTASGVGTGTVTQTTDVITPIRTASGFGTSSQSATGYLTPEIQRQAFGSGTGASVVEYRREHLRTATDAVTGTATATWTGSPRPLPPPSPTNQARVKSRQTTTVITTKPVIHMVLPLQRVQSLPRLVFDYVEDDETMLCLA